MKSGEDPSAPPRGPRRRGCRTAAAMSKVPRHVLLQTALKQSSDMAKRAGV
eukprot:gene16531-23104_t